MPINIGTAGWSIPRDVGDQFPAEGTSLERYSARFPVAEINSSFHRSHRASTWERWAESVPTAFRFSTKLPKTITHVAKLRDCTPLINAFLAEVAGLGPPLAVLLVQLPPKLAYDVELVGRFFGDLNARTAIPIACEPRHASWFEPGADEMLKALRIARVAADPACCADADCPGGWRGLAYWRLHGSPVKYRSSYAGRIRAIAAELVGGSEARDIWCIFDNTASSAAAANALALMSEVMERR